jgi:hypothetical protein
MGRMVIVAYRPKPECETELLGLCAEHLPLLRAEGLASSRPEALMRAEDGTVIEVFEWASDKAIERAHRSPAVQKLWSRFAEVCDDIPVANVPEASKLFPEFAAVSPETDAP